MTRQGASESTSGFTLLELIVVLVVLGLVAALAMPRLGAPPGHVLLQASAGEISMTLRRLRAAALRTNSEQALTIDNARQAYWSTLDERPKTLSGARMAVSGACLAEQAGETSVIRFRPDGSACDARLALRNGQQEADIIVEWVSGTVRVEWRL